MRRDQKIGLFVGMGVIILIGILISDHLAVVQEQEGPRFSQVFPEGEAGSPDQPPGELVIDDSRPLTPPGQPVARRAEPRNTQQPENVSEPIRFIQTLDNLRSATAVRDREEPQPTTLEVPSEPAESDVFVPVKDNGLTQEEIKVLDRLPLNGPKASEPARASGPVVHFVKEGETLSEIARRYYGPTGKWQVIYTANRSVIPDADDVSPGTRLVVPSLKPVAPAAPQASVKPPASTPKPAAPKPAPAAPAFNEYTVKRGETLSQVAAKLLGSSGKWRQLHELNKDRIKDPNRVAPGTVIRVPKK